MSEIFVNLKLHIAGINGNISTLSNFIGLFYSLFWIDLKWSVGGKGLRIETKTYHIP